MTDKQPLDKDAAGTSEVEPEVGVKPTPTRSAGAAASRARRIGGGTAPAPPRRAAPAEPDTVAEATSSDTVLTKPAKAPAKPAKSVKVTKDAADAESKPKRAPVVLPGWLTWVPAGVFTALAIAFVVLFLVDHVGNGSTVPSTKQRETVLAATKNCVAATNTYRYTNVDRYEQAGLKCATGVYKRQYGNAMETLIKKNAPTQKFVQTAQINSAGIEAVTRDGKQWTVLVYGQLNITSATEKGRVDPFALQATMQQVGGKWLIAKVKLLSTINGG